MSRETEFVPASQLRDGDVLPRYGKIKRILNDSSVLSVDTDSPPYGFMKSQHAPVERYKSITCPVCGMTSYSPNDIREGYCGNCHDWTSA